jgi:hypothetical protein
MKNESGNDAMESVRALIIFPLAPEWKQVLLMHGCTFGEHEYGEMVIFPEGTTRTLLLSRTGQPTNRSRIQLPDGVELREVLDDEGTGNSWLLLVLSQEPMQDTRIARDHLQGRMRGEGATEERREARKIASIIAASRIRQVVGDGMQAQQGMEEQDEWEGPGEHNMEEAQALIEKALARVGLITVLTRRLESHGDLLARIAAAELRDDPNWRAFTRGIVRYHRRRRKNHRKRW